MGEQGHSLLVNTAGKIDDLADNILIYREAFEESENAGKGLPKVALSLPLVIAKSDEEANGVSRSLSVEIYQRMGLCCG